MFSLVTGGMRSGKTYLLTKLALSAIAQGRVVCTDIPLNVIDFPNLYKWEWSALTDIFDTNDQRVERYPYIDQGGVLYLLDEGWKGLKSGDRSISNNMQLMSFFREHGQCINDDGLANDIVLCTQNFKSLNAQIRELADVTILCVKPSGLGIKNMTLNYHIDGAWSSLRPPRAGNADLILKTDRLFLDPEVYKCYNSHAKTKAKNGINKGGYDREGTMSKGQTVFSSWSMRLAAVFVLFCFWFVPKTAMTLINEQKGEKHESENVKVDIKKNVIPVDNLHSASITSLDNNIAPRHAKELDVRQLDDKKHTEVSNTKPLSSNWRIASVLTSKKTKKLLIYAVDSNGHVKRIDPGLCVNIGFDKAWSCQLDNELITQFSGSYAKSSQDKDIFSLSK